MKVASAVPGPCQECSRRREYEALLFEVVRVLEATRRSFKSSQLGALRERVLEVLERNR